MIRKVTIRDVAAASGVSITAVSQILNGKGQRFSSETQEKVHYFQHKLGYVPDFSARHLIIKSTETIGVLTPDLANPFFSMFIKGVQQTAYEENFIPLIFSANHDEHLETSYLQELIRRAVDGLIIASASITAQAIDQSLRRNGIPYILLDQNAVSDGDRVNVDDRHGGELAAQHLLSLGHTQIAVVVPEHATVNIINRLNGFIDWMKSTGHPFSEDWVVHTPMNKEGGYEAATQECVKRATAIFAINDEMAIGLYRGLHERGLRIPEDISVIGYDDIDWGNYVTPALTTIHQPVFEMGQAATQLLTQRIRTGNRPFQTVRLPVRLVKRESTGRAR